MVRYRNRKGRKSKRPPKEQFNYWYYDLEMPAEEIAKMCNCRIDTVYNWAHQFRKEEELEEATSL